jgi:2-keto-4-pentenoate hydratase/2-oxohepta-3-ene-1,7-dioic acid hydratase in catechol pathway
VPGAGRRPGREVLLQQGTTADMIWGVAELVAYISRSITLEAGDIVATGTPSGVGVFRDPPLFLEPGDRARCEIERICSMENPVIDWADDEVDEFDDDEFDVDETVGND